MCSSSRMFTAVALQFSAVGGAQQLNDKNGKRLALKFAATNKFAVVIAKLRLHLPPGEDNLVRPARRLLPWHEFIPFCSSVSSRVVTRSFAPRLMPCSVTCIECVRSPRRTSCCNARIMSRVAESPCRNVCLCACVCSCCLKYGIACCSHRALLQTAKRPAIMVVSYCSKINYG